MKSGESGKEENFIYYLIAIFLAVYLFTSCSTQKNENPNIIFLMDDQHRWDAFGFVNHNVISPTFDQLAKDGIFFDQAVCQAPMCVPSRYAMMLNLYPNQIGVLSNRKGLPDNELPAITLPQIFKEAGYQTAGFGKTHWRSDSCSKRGFEIRYIDALYEKGAILMQDVYPEGYKRYIDENKPFGPGEENNLGYIGMTSALPEGDQRDGWVFNQCMNFIENGIDSSRPLFLYLSFLKPHASANVPAGYADRYNIDDIPLTRQPPWDKDNSPHATGLNRTAMYESFWKEADDQLWKSMKLHYWANCTWLDDMFGRTIDKLREKGILDNAIIVYISDHGEMLGERFYRFNKYCFYESSVRVPIILSGSILPDNLRNTTDHRPAELVDIYPTILNLAGIKQPPEGVGLNLLGGEKHIAGFSAIHQHPEQASFMWRNNNYKLILVFKRKDSADKYNATDIIDGEFYDLKNDPKEWDNLYQSASVKTIRDKMTKQLLERLKQLKKRQSIIKE